MTPRARRLILGATAAVVVVFALAVLLDKPASHTPVGSQRAGTSTSSATNEQGTSSGTSASPGGSASPGESASAGEFDGAALPPDTPAHVFTLTDQDGRRISLASYRGEPVVLAFLYSGCGATCLVIAQQVRGALNELPQPVPVLFVSVDPSGDTRANVERFLESVSLQHRVHFLTASRPQLEGVWRAYGVVPASAGRAAFDRSASVFLIDPEGRLRVLFQTEQLTPEALAHDIELLRSGH
jgi:protein SCO1/2